MVTSAKPREHQLGTDFKVRPARSSDDSVLGALGVASGASVRTLVAERADEIVAALTVAERPFETRFLGRKTAHIDMIGGRETTALAPLVSATLNRLFDEGFGLVTARRASGERPVIDALQAAGFQAIERLVTLSRPLPANKTAMPTSVTIALPDDAEGCAKVASEAFTFDRFHADPSVDDAAANELKAQWARNSVGGRADRVFVTRENGAITGFNACLLRGDTAIIDLIGVARSFQGKGLGRALVAAAVAHYSGKAARMIVGTQEANAASLSLYRDAGFKPLSTSITFHAHA